MKELGPEMLLWEQCPIASGPTAGPTYMVADPDPDGTDNLQVTVGLLEQVAHQLLKAALDCHLGSGRGVLYQGLNNWISICKRMKLDPLRHTM